MVEIRYIHPRDLHIFWPIVKPGIEKVAEYGNGWIPEDVYSSVRGNAATLHVGFKDGRYVGCMVLAPIANPWNGQKELEVWAVYSVDPDAFDFGMEEIERIAREYGAARICLLSPRKGWERRLAPYGFRPGMTRFEKTLGD